MNFTLSIPEEKLELIKNEAARLGIPISAYFKMKALENLKSNFEEENKNS